MEDMTDAQMSAMVATTRLNLGNSCLAEGNHEAAKLAFNAVLQVASAGDADTTAILEAARLGLQRVAEARAELDSWLNGSDDDVGGAGIELEAEPEPEPEPEPGPERTTAGRGAAPGEDELLWRQEQLSRLEYSEDECQVLAAAMAEAATATQGGDEEQRNQAQLADEYDAQFDSFDNADDWEEELHAAWGEETWADESWAEEAWADEPGELELANLAAVETARQQRVSRLQDGAPADALEEPETGQEDQLHGATEHQGPGQGGEDDDDLLDDDDFAALQTSSEEENVEENAETQVPEEGF
jgi:hypothetical protein